MKNWKTTLVGALTAIIIAVQGVQSHNLSTVGMAVGIALLGFFAKDFEAASSTAVTPIPPPTQGAVKGN